MKKQEQKEKQLTYFNSSVTQDHFGNATALEMIETKEMIHFLNSVPDLVDKKAWLGLVVNGYVGRDCYWDEESLIKWLHQLRDDIRLIQSRVAEIIEKRNLSEDNQ